MASDNKTVACFVILHYQVIVDTIECIESIFEQSFNESFIIIVVDNNSPNKSGVKLINKYKTNPKVDILISERNLGFANGNNLGCSYAIKNHYPNYLIVINNDTLIKQRNFISQIAKLDSKFEFHVLGPDVISLKSNEHQSPIEYAITTKGKIFKAIIFNSWLTLISYINIDNNFLLLWNKRKPTQSNQKKAIKTDLEGVKLYGAALIFARRYFERYPNVFFEKSFMYVEEDILFYRCIRDNLKSVYSPTLKVLHKEDMALNTLYSKDVLGRRFVYKHSIMSLFGLFAYLRSK